MRSEHCTRDGYGQRESSRGVERFTKFRTTPCLNAALQLRETMRIEVAAGSHPLIRTVGLENVDTDRYLVAHACSRAYPATVPDADPRVVVFVLCDDVPVGTP